MSIEINTIIIGGNLARDVDLKEIASGRKVATFSLASNRTYIVNGEKKKEVVFVDVDVWGAIGENCHKYLKKGSPVVVTGRLKQDQWQTDSGEKRSRIKVVAMNVQFLYSGKNTGATTKQDFPEANDVAWDE